MPGDQRAARVPRHKFVYVLPALIKASYFSSHVSCFWSRALFLSINRCLAAVIESSVFRFEILTISVEESETTYVEAIDLAPVVQRLNNAIHRINCYPVDKC